MGLNFCAGSGTVFQDGSLTVRNHGVGLLADGTGTSTMLSNPSKSSSIVDNGTDVDPNFITHTTNTHY